MQAELFDHVKVRGYNRRRPRQKAPDTRLLLADVLSLMAEMGAPKREEVARRYFGVRKRLREIVQ